jgi:hypothetical protein
VVSYEPFFSNNASPTVLGGGASAGVTLQQFAQPIAIALPTYNLDNSHVSVSRWVFVV